MKNRDFTVVVVVFSVFHYQARIHTGFYCSTEIGQIFHNKYILVNTLNFPS